MSQRHTYDVSVVLSPNGALHVILIMSLSSFKYIRNAEMPSKKWLDLSS